MPCLTSIKVSPCCGLPYPDSSNFWQLRTHFLLSLLRMPGRTKFLDFNMTPPLTLLGVTILAAHISMADNDRDLDPNISNGACFFYDGTQMDKRFIPCGNGLLSYKSCCESQDMCLSSHACYNGQCEYQNFVRGRPC
jgi:hypothetical protein